MASGQHRIEYEVLEGWERMPEGWSFVEVAGVACDSNDRVYHTVHKFTTDGTRLMTLGVSGKAADTGYKIGARPVLRSAG